MHNFVRRSHLLVLLALAFAVPAYAQEEAPPGKRPGVQITFIPPPMEGKLALGIYDKGGKLVRVLARDATAENFTVGLNGFITQWDGAGDDGKPLPAGSYTIRGYSVGEVGVEGVAYHCNDWMIDDESPQIRRVLAIELRQSGRLVLWAEGADGRPRLVRCDQAGEFNGEIPADPKVSALAVGALPGNSDPAAATRSRAVITPEGVAIVEGEQNRVLKLPDVTQPLDASLARDSVWVIDQAGAQTEVKEFGLDGEFRRHLKIDPAEPAPRRVFASRTSDLIFLIEEAPGVQRVRGLELASAQPGGDTAGDRAATSNWKTVLSKSIIASDDFAAVATHLGRKTPFQPAEKFSVQLTPNTLLKNALTTVDVSIGFDATGSFLKTLDGLPLRRITESPHLRWAIFGKEGSGRQLTIFQGDGAVVEEFKAHKLANMMAFDAGEYAWDPAAATAPAPSPATSDAAGQK